MSAFRVELVREIQRLTSGRSDTQLFVLKEQTWEPRPPWACRKARSSCIRSGGRPLKVVRPFPRQQERQKKLRGEKVMRLRQEIASGLISLHRLSSKDRKLLQTEGQGTGLSGSRSGVESSGTARDVAAGASGAAGAGDWNPVRVGEKIMKNKIVHGTWVVYGLVDPECRTVLRRLHGRPGAAIVTTHLQSFQERSLGGLTYAACVRVDSRRPWSFWNQAYVG